MGVRLILSPLSGGRGDTRSSRGLGLGGTENNGPTFIFNIFQIIPFLGDFYTKLKKWMGWGWDGDGGRFSAFIKPPVTICYDPLPRPIHPSLAQSL